MGIPRTPEARERHSAYLRKLRAESAESRDSFNASKAAYQKRNPHKNRAHRSVMKAIKSGRLTRGPCEVCGNQKAQAHHDDYSKRLEVRWLCSVHHRDWHLVHGEAKNGGD